MKLWFQSNRGDFSTHFFTWSKLLIKSSEGSTRTKVPEWKQNPLNKMSFHLIILQKSTPRLHRTIKYMDAVTNLKRKKTSAGLTTLENISFRDSISAYQCTMRLIHLTSFVKRAVPSPSHRHFFGVESTYHRKKFLLHIPGDQNHCFSTNNRG